MLVVDKLGKTFQIRSGRKESKQLDPREHGRQFEAVKSVSFEAPRGTILGLLGPNGAGKTTLLRMLSTALVPTTGTASIDGIDIVTRPLEVQRRTGFMSGATGLYGRLTPREMVTYFAELHRMEPAKVEARIAELFDLLDMNAYADKRNDDLSAGMKQKVSIARTLVHDPSVIFFDEPTTGLDVAAAQTIIELLMRCRDQGKTVVFSTHHMHEVEQLCERVVIIAEGNKCFEGNVAQMRERGKHVQLDRAFLGIIEDAKQARAA